MLHLIFKPRTRHRILHTLLLTNYFNVFAFSLFSPLFTIFALHYGATAFTLSGALAIYALTLGVLLIVFGHLQNSIKNKRAVVVIGYFVLSLTAITFLFVHTLRDIYLVQILNAAATAWMTPAWKALYGKYEETGHETEEWALADGGNQLLLSTATFLGGSLLTIIGFRFLIILMASLQLLGAFFSLQIFAPETADT